MYRLPAGFDDAACRDLLAYWESKRRGGKLPSRRDVDPLDLPVGLLPQILLFDVLREAGRLRFRFRVAGTAFAQLAGRDVTGLCYDELGPAERTAPVINLLTLACQQARPSLLVSRVTARQDAHEDISRLALPLAADGATVDMVLGVWGRQPLAERDSAARSGAETPQMLEGS